MLSRGTEPGRGQGGEDFQEMGERLTLHEHVIRTLIRMEAPEGPFRTPAQLPGRRDAQGVS